VLKNRGFYRAGVLQNRYSEKPVTNMPKPAAFVKAAASALASWRKASEGPGAGADMTLWISVCPAWNPGKTSKI
jgi:hypothetical protein